MEGNKSMLDVLLPAATSDSHAVAERQHRLNPRPIAFPDVTLHELFEAQVRRVPDTIALRTQSESLSYAELNARANQLARHLRRLGVATDERVALCVERGVLMVTAVLAVLKAGGAYVPLDPTYPIERLSYMLRDSQPRVLLSQRKLRHVFPEGASQTVYLEDIGEIVSGLPEGDLSPADTSVTPRSLAYVIYTSGSTGSPKGAMNEHRGMVNRVRMVEHIEAYSDADVCSQKTAISFVDSVFEIFGALCNGRPLVIIPDEAVRNPSEMAAIVERLGVTQLITVPSLARLMLENAEITRRLQGLRCWTLSGEEVAADLVLKLQSQLPACDVISLYGASEISSDAATFRTSKFAGTRVPIGRPVPNVEIYILDAQRNPVPVGEVGEIWVGGVGVGRGYHQRPDLTADRFVKDPFEAGRGRFYRTGDLGRWRTDGLLECLGRMDSQVKIRGFRVELSEIETQLRSFEEVREAVVVARGEVAEQSQLVAYLTVREERFVNATALRMRLRQKLPHFMVPAAFVVMPQLPRTPNGKLDRRALPEPARDAFSSVEYEAPKGETEQWLAELWKALLGVPAIGRHDHFLEMGGHSLLILRLLGQLYELGYVVQATAVFEHPTIEGLARVLDERRQAVAFAVPPNLILPQSHRITPEMLPLASLTQREIDRLVSAVPGGVGNIQDIYALAPLQQGLLFHHLLDQNRGDTYVQPILLSLRTHQQLQSLIAGLQKLIDSHDVLRTAVFWDDLSHPVQVVLATAALPVESNRFASEEQALVRLKESMRPENLRLDLHHAPLMKLLVAEVANSEQVYALFLTHHLVCDNASLDAMVSEIVAGASNSTYEPAAQIPYRDHVARSLSNSAFAENARRYFRERLGDVDEPSAPFGITNTRTDGSRTLESRQILLRSLGSHVRAVAHKRATSPAALFHAAWSLVVAGTSARNDVVFGTVLFGRMQGAVDPRRALGMFINTLPIRLILSGLTAESLVSSVRDELVALLTHEQTSLAEAQRCSAVANDAPLFTSILNYRHSTTEAGMGWSAADGIEVLATQERTNFPVMMSVDDLHDQFVLVAQTDQRIDPTRICEYLKNALASLLEALDSAPNTPALRLGILGEDERRQVLTEVNSTQAPYPMERRVHELFQQQAVRSPDAVAIIAGEASLTFEELNQRSNHLGNYLISCGVTPGDRVGLCLERSIEMVVGLLGILKAGAVYVPLDPAYPPERIQYMLEDASPTVVVTQSALKQRIAFNGNFVVLDSEWTDIARCSAADSVVQHDHSIDTEIAYVIYTSGSTGRPKGVMVEHRGLVNFLWGMCKVPGVVEHDCVLAVTTISFDIAALEIFAPLISGAKVVIASREAVADAHQLITLIDTHKVTVLQATPATWQLLLTAGWTGRSALKALCGGEALTRRLSFELMTKVSELWNLYGPTETTVWSCRHRIEPHPASDAAVESIGKPIENTQVYVLNSERQPVPWGVAGEIYIGGHGVARGYRNRPSLTAERFFVNHFEDDEDARMYRTGDLGRWQPDGTLAYLGRNDHQVKIRGFRIELGEVEAQLAQHPDVRAVAVTTMESSPGGKIMVGYIVVGDGRDLDVPILRAFLKTRLPEYMVPSAFVQLEHLPLTPNGKVDRKALPAPRSAVLTSEHYEPPQGALESRLAEIWQSVLSVERVGRREDFFEVGGHSLIAMQVTVRIRSAFGVDMQVGSLFDHRTVEALAVHIDRLRRSRLQERLASGAENAQALLHKVKSMPARRVEALVRKLRQGVKP